MKNRERYYRVIPLGERIPLNWFEEKIRDFQERHNNDVEDYNEAIEDGDFDDYEDDRGHDYRYYRDPRNHENDHRSEDDFDDRYENRDDDYRNNNFRRSDQDDHDRAGNYIRNESGNERFSRGDGNTNRDRIIYRRRYSDWRNR